VVDIYIHVILPEITQRVMDGEKLELGNIIEKHNGNKNR